MSKNTTAEQATLPGTPAPAPVAPKQRKKREPRPANAADLLIEQAQEWHHECRKLRPAFDSIAVASRKGLIELKEQIRVREETLDKGGK